MNSMKTWWKKFQSKRRFRRRFMDKMGVIARRDGERGYPMAYGMEHGYLMWAPGWVKDTVCTVWNFVNCSIYGHDLMEVEAFKTHSWPGAPRCINCSANLRVDGKYPTPEEVKANDIIVREQWAKDFPNEDSE